MREAKSSGIPSTSPRPFRIAFTEYPSFERTESHDPGLSGAAHVLEDPDRRRAIAMALAGMTPDDVLVVAGKGHEAYQQIGDEKLPFHDATVVKELARCA